MQLYNNPLSRVLFQMQHSQNKMATRHPTLHEVLLPLYTRDDFSRAAEILEAINPEHVNESERNTLTYEMPTLRQYSTMPTIIKVSIERLMGLRSPRHFKDCAIYTYSNPLTAKLEHLAITQTLESLRGTKLGAMLYEKASTRFKPKHILAAMKSSPFRDIAQNMAQAISKPMTGEQVESRVIVAFSETTVRGLVADSATSVNRAEQIAPSFTFAEIDNKWAERIEYYRSGQSTPSV